MKIPVVRLTLLFLLVAFRAAAQTEGTVRSSDGTPVYYRTFGSGQPLLIINGGPGMNSDGFVELAGQLGQKYQAIIYDQRGTGKSQPVVLDTTTITIDLMIDDIETLRKHLGLQKWSVLGHSFGGMVASYYATVKPECIDKMILSSSGGIDLSLLNYVQAAIQSGLSKAQRDSVAYWDSRIAAGDTSYYARLQRGKSLAPAYVVNKKFIPVIAERLTQGNRTVNSLIWANLVKINFDCAAKLTGFNHPVLIIQGKQDIIKPETAEKAHKALKNSRVVYLPHCVHYGWLDNPQVYFSEIDATLAGTD